MAKECPLYIDVTVLQNGIPVASFRRKAAGHWTVRLDGAMQGPLSVAGHSVAPDAIVFQCRGQQVRLNCQHLSRGILQAGHKYIPITKSNTTLKEKLKNGDFGSLNVADLTVVFRLHVPKKAQVVPYNPRFRGSFSTLLNVNGRTLPQLCIAALLACCLLGGFVGGLLLRPDDRPKQFADLNEGYTLPFVDHEKIASIPEAANVQMEPTDLMKTTIRYYDAIAGLTTSSVVPQTSLLYPNSVALGISAKKQQAMEFHAATEKVMNSVEEISAVEEAGIVSLPSVPLQHTDAQLSSMRVKISQHVLGLRAQLVNRRTTQLQFQDDAGYEYNQFSKEKASPFAGLKKDGGANAVSQINFSGQLGAEEQMYQDANQMAAKALRLQSIKPDISPIPSEPNLVLVADDPWFVFAAEALAYTTSGKTARVQGEPFGLQAKPKAVPQKVIIGSLDPQKIEDIIHQNQFELRLCFELALRRNHSVTGNMRWRWLISPQGTTQNIELLDSSIGDTAMVQCIRGKISRWIFPKPRGGSVRVSRAFSFQPDRG